MKNVKGFMTVAAVVAMVVMTASCSKDKDDDNNSGSGQATAETWVDLGLPSGLLWATSNVGSSTAEGFGTYFAWGETSAKDSYGWDSYRYANGADNQLTKYCNDEEYGYEGFTDALTTLEAADDAATANVTGARIPTRDEWQELMATCTGQWVEQNGVTGYRFSSRTTGKSIFLPAAGSRWDDTTGNVGSWGGYWSANIDEDKTYAAMYLDFSQDGADMGSFGSRSDGRTVRAVRKK